MRATAMIALLVITSAWSAVPVQPSPAYWVFAWSTPHGGARRYAVVKNAEKRMFLDDFNRSLPGMATVAELEARLNALPKGMAVGFGDATCVGITYPPNNIMSQIKQFAAANNIRLLILPGACE